MDKSRSIPRSNYSNKSTRIEKPSHSSETPNTLRIPRKNKRKKTPDTSIIRKQHIQEPVNPKKREKEDTITDVEKYCPK